MLINCDVKGLEVVVAAELSGDEVLCKEIIDKVDVHGENQKAFGLPTRLIAKTFKFRLIYGGSAYSYANDSDFIPVSRDQKFWQDVIDRYYAKYVGIQQWHTQLIVEAQRNGKLEIPSGRHFPIVPDFTKRDPWPITIIKNYPVQGFGADLVMLARLEIFKRIREEGLECKLVSTIHDSIVGDCPEHELQHIARIMFDAIEKIPLLCKQVFGYEFKLPLTSEIQYGMNKKDMQDLTFA